MANYYILDCKPPLEVDHYRLQVGYPANDKRWVEGIIFSDQDTREGFHPPDEPIGLNTKADTEDSPRVYADLYWIPIPLMSRRLVAAFRAAGVDNLQTFETKLLTVLGDKLLPADNYLAVNIVGCVTAADLEKSQTNPEVMEKMVSMDFHSLSVDESKARGSLIFRMAENVTAVLVHEDVRRHIEAGGITTLTWFAPEEWAG